ncbi:hypothetical protein B7R54_18190 [Subtercola boreus]|uniref:DUF2000 domain-containing protein n=1 Tax=Subtercola boreus TaxID=120213 RepID=A0A3E0VMH6_9MICO|nr:DUF2000 domain-containing protein [Subtercola boreus]RFA10921.1 hypothetical protein B7R54_18190 [Subtercola boreus]TQL55485.1 uncharacterized protein DUF2000 [Subtercola boreus]
MSTPAATSAPAFESHEITTSESTRSARLKWVIIVDRDLPAGLAVNAAACVAASVGASVGGMLGPSGLDADGAEHPGLPWAGCSILAATPEELLAVRAAVLELNAAASDPTAATTSATTSLTADAATAPGTVHLTDMPQSAQTNRVYDSYLTELAATSAADLRSGVLSIVGPRKKVDRLTKRLALL